MLQAGYKREEICKVIGRDKSILSRELARNADQRSKRYSCDLAVRKCAKRHLEKNKKIYFTSSIKSDIESYLKQEYSPEQIVGFAKQKNISCVSVERIYQFIWEDKKCGGYLYKYLRHQGRRYRKRGSSKDSRGIIKNRVSISKRPKIVDKRKRIGDLEMGTIIGCNHKGAILTINDRVTGMLKMVALKSRHADEVTKATITALQDWKASIKTITTDNGKEFAGHEKISKVLGVSFYFANPYCSGERGSNENLNGLIRQYIPKKTNLTTISNEMIKNIENKINNRPRKRFNFKSRIDVYNIFLTKKSCIYRLNTAYKILTKISY